MKKALITGITGQDGSYLAELLLHKGYEVHGIIRRASTFNTHRLEHIYRDPHNGDKVNLHLHYGDIAVAETLQHAISGEPGTSMDLVLERNGQRFSVRLERQIVSE